MATRDVNTLDMVYANVREAFPLYITIRPRTAPKSKEIRIWPDGSLEQVTGLL